MTANELADWIEGQGNGGAGNMHSQTAAMLWTLGQFSDSEDE